MLTVSDSCYRCGDCIKACPVPNTITNILPGKVKINSFSCIECNQCIPVCRFGLITNEKEPNIHPSVNIVALIKEATNPDPISVKVGKVKRSK